VVFKLAPRSNGKWKYSVLYRVTGQGGRSPQASVILDDNGELRSGDDFEDHAVAARTAFGCGAGNQRGRTDR
jgi:hypothetical protein